MPRPVVTRAAAQSIPVPLSPTLPPDDSAPQPAPKPKVADNKAVVPMQQFAQTVTLLDTFRYISGAMGQLSADKNEFTPFLVYIELWLANSGDVGIETQTMLTAASECGKTRQCSMARTSTTSENPVASHGCRVFSCGA